MLQEYWKYLNGYEKSIFCFTSDHGDMLGDHHLWRKTYAYEGPSNIPFIVKWPAGKRGKLARGSELENPVELHDFLPTFLGAAGAEIPKEMNGLSLQPNQGAWASEVYVLNSKALQCEYTPKRWTAS